RADKMEFKEEQMKQEASLQSELEKVQTSIEGLYQQNSKRPLDEDAFIRLEEKLLVEKTDLKSRLKSLSHDPQSFMFEPVDTVLETLNQAAESVAKNELSQIASVVKKTCSNSLISQQIVSLELNPVYAFIAS